MYNENYQDNNYDDYMYDDIREEDIRDENGEDLEVFEPDIPAWVSNALVRRMWIQDIDGTIFFPSVFTNDEKVNDLKYQKSPEFADKLLNPRENPTAPWVNDYLLEFASAWRIYYVTGRHSFQQYPTEFSLQNRNKCLFNKERGDKIYYCNFKDYPSYIETKVKYINALIYDYIFSCVQTSIFITEDSKSVIDAVIAKMKPNTRRVYFNHVVNGHLTGWKDMDDIPYPKEVLFGDYQKDEHSG